MGTKLSGGVEMKQSILILAVVLGLLAVAYATYDLPSNDEFDSELIEVAAPGGLKEKIKKKAKQAKNAVKKGAKKAGKKAKKAVKKGTKKVKKAVKKAGSKAKKAVKKGGKKAKKKMKQAKKAVKKKK